VNHFLGSLFSILPSGDILKLKIEHISFERNSITLKHSLWKVSKFLTKEPHIGAMYNIFHIVEHTVILLHVPEMHPWGLILPCLGNLSSLLTMNIHLCVLDIFVHYILSVCMCVCRNNVLKWKKTRRHLEK